VLSDDPVVRFPVLNDITKFLFHHRLGFPKAALLLGVLATYQLCAQTAEAPLARRLFADDGVGKLEGEGLVKKPDKAVRRRDLVYHFGVKAGP